MITLPPGPRRKWLMSFWLALSLLGGALVGACLAIAISPDWFVAGGIVALTLAVPGLLRPHVASRPYEMWRQAARSYCRLVCLVLTAICFSTVAMVGRFTGSSLRLTRPPSAGTMWIPRTAATRAAYARQYNGATRPSCREGWLGTYLSWTAQSDHAWAAALLPFLAMLEIFEPGAEKASPTNIYTLF